MGASKKWLKALLGLKKSDKSHSFDTDENVVMILILFEFTEFSLIVFWILDIFSKIGEALGRSCTRTISLPTSGEALVDTIY